MVKVENRKTIWVLTRRFMKNNKGRNVIAVISIMLTALLFTSLFAGSVSMILSKRAADIVNGMDSSHACAQSQTVPEAQKIVDAVRKGKDVARFGEGIFLGPAIDKRMKFAAEVRSGDRNLIESFNCLPSTGKLPEKENEIAMSTIVLDALKIPHKIGEQVTLNYEADPNEKVPKTDTFTLSGFWVGDKSVMSQIIWVSNSYAEKYSYTVTEEEIGKGIYNGTRDVVIWFKSIWNLNGKIATLSNLIKDDKVKEALDINPAYDLFQEDAFSFGSLAVLVLFVLLAGCLIIYNIFNISVKTDIQTYGLLKNVGTTGKQLKKVVRRQAFCLSGIGIPVGLVLGFLVTLLMAPILNANSDISTQMGQSVKTVVSANPFIFIGAGLFTLLTVYLSCMQACRMVGCVSPVEAMQLAQSSYTRRKRKKNTSVSSVGMALQNVRNSWKRGIIVMISIALTLVVVDSIVMLTRGYDLELYEKDSIASDFELGQMTGTLSTSNFNGISSSEREMIEKCPDKTASGYVYYSLQQHKMEPGLREFWRKIEKAYSKDYWAGAEEEEYDKTVKSGQIRVHYMGISKSIFNKLEWTGEPVKWAEFADGNHVLVNANLRYCGDSTFYKKGSAIQLDVRNGKTKKYTVSGLAELPFSLNYPFWEMTGIMVLVPDTEYFAQTDNDFAMYASIDVKKGTEKEAQHYLKNSVLKENDMIQENSCLAMEESFQRFINKYFIIGGMLVFVLGWIGVMNYFNTVVTSIISRKRELALLEVVGMTKVQVKKMLVAESCIYIAGAFAVAVGLIFTIVKALLVNTFGLVYFFKLHLTIVPCVVIMPVLVAIAVIIPKWQYGKMSNESLVERIKVE